MIGWIKVYRKIQDHWLYENKRPKTKLEAWIHILLTVNFKESKMLTRGVIYDCKRGQSLFSLQTWAKEFNWSVQSVRTFFNQLEKDEMIHTEGLQYTTRLTVCNYESYQDESTDEQQTNNTPLTDGQQTANKPLTTIEERKKEKNDKELILFDSFRIKYPGTKRGNETEFENFQKKHKDWKVVLPNLEYKLERIIALRVKKKQSGEWIPEWKNLQTWINQRCWEEEVEQPISLA